MNVKFSVLIPTFNRRRLLRRALESVLAQTYPIHEVIVIDDGSTDGTQEEVQRFVTERRADSACIQYLHQDNGGRSAALNTGMTRVTGDWIAFLDDDDIWMPEKLEWQVRAVESTGGRAGACFTDAAYVVNGVPRSLTYFGSAKKSFRAEIGEIPDPIRYLLHPPHGLMPTTMVVRCDLARAAGPYDPVLLAREDYDFFFLVARLTTFAYVNRVLAQIDRSNNRGPSLMQFAGDDSVLLRMRQHIYEKWLDLSSGMDSDIRRAILKSLGDVHSGWATGSLASGDYVGARRSMGVALRYGRSPRIALKWLLVHVWPSVARRICERHWNGPRGSRNAGSLNQ